MWYIIYHMWYIIDHMWYVHNITMLRQEQDLNENYCRRTFPGQIKSNHQRQVGEFVSDTVSRSKTVKVEGCSFLWDDNSSVQNKLPKTILARPAGLLREIIKRKWSRKQIFTKWRQKATSSLLRIPLFQRAGPKKYKKIISQKYFSIWLFIGLSAERAAGAEVEPLAWSQWQQVCQ